MMLRFIKNCFAFVVFFFIYYYETYVFFGVKFSILWKAMLMAYIIFLLYLKPNKNIRWIRYGYYYNFEMLLGMSSFVSPLSTLFVLSKSIVFPIFLQFFNLESNLYKLFRYLKLLSIFTSIWCRCEYDGLNSCVK